MPLTDQFLTARARHALTIALIIISALYTFRWVFYPEMTFYVDDWNWLNRAVFVDWERYFTISTLIPSAIYNDRPPGAMSVKLLYQFFGLNFTGFAAVTLTVHIMNGIAMYFLASRLLASWFYGSIAAILFVVDYNVAYPVWWPATITNSWCLFFCLCSFLAFLSQKSYATILSALLYYLAVRSKEAALPFPLVLVAYSFLEHNSSLKWSEIWKSLLHALRSTWPVLLAFAFLFGLSMKYFIALKLAAADFGPYAPKFDLSTMVDGLKIYLRYIAFDQISQTNALIAFIALTIIALLRWNRPAILGAGGFIVASTPVLVLATQRVPYYAYIPCPYAILLLVAVVQDFNNALERWIGPLWDHLSKLVILGATVWFVGYIYSAGLYRESLLAQMRENSLALKTLQAAVSHVELNSKIVILNLPHNTNLFVHAPCHAIVVVYKVQTIDCRIEGEPADLRKLYESFPAPKILLNYDAGNVTLLDQKP